MCFSLKWKCFPLFLLLSLSLTLSPALSVLLVALVRTTLCLSINFAGAENFQPNRLNTWTKKEAKNGKPLKAIICRSVIAVFPFHSLFIFLHFQLTCGRHISFSVSVHTLPLEIVDTALNFYCVYFFFGAGLGRDNPHIGCDKQFNRLASS